MNLPLEIVVRHLPLSEPQEAAIRGKAAKLEQFYGRIVRCRVLVEGPGPHHRQGKHRVRIDLTVPRGEIVVTKQSGDGLAEATREAFNAATRRLEDYVRRVRRFVKTHEERVPTPAAEP